MMLRSRVLNRMVASVALILLGMLLSWLLLGGGASQLLKGSTPSNALAAPSLPSSSQATEPNQDFYTCTSSGVAVYTNRIHVECTAATGAGIRFFALGTSDTNHAARTLTLLSMAHVTGKSLYIAFDQGDTSGEAFGCLTSDCRLIQHVTILP